MTSFLVYTVIPLLRVDLSWFVYTWYPGIWNSHSLTGCKQCFGRVSVTIMICGFRYAVSIDSSVNLFNKESTLVYINISVSR